MIANLGNTAEGCVPSCILKTRQSSIREFHFDTGALLCMSGRRLGEHEREANDKGGGQQTNHQESEITFHTLFPFCLEWCSEIVSPTHVGSPKHVGFLD